MSERRSEITDADRIAYLRYQATCIAREYSVSRVSVVRAGLAMDVLNILDGLRDEFVRAWKDSDGPERKPT